MLRGMCVNPAQLISFFQMSLQDGMEQAPCHKGTWNASEGCILGAEEF